MDRAIAILIFLLVLVVGTILIAPSYIDWNAYKPTIEAYAEDLTGRDVTLGGDVGFQLIPEPALTIEDLAIANADGDAEGDTLRLDRLEVLAALKPLLMGDLQVTDVRLVKPQIAVEILAGNRTNWSFDEADPRVPPVMKERPWWLTMIANAITLEHVSIEDGTLTYVDGGTVMRDIVRNLNADLSAATLQGPFESTGSATMRGVDFSFDYASGDTSTVRAVPLRFALTLKPSEAVLTYRGFMEQASLFGPLQGKLSYTAKSADQGLHDLFSLINGARVAAVKGAAAKALKNDLAVETDLSVSGRDLHAENVTIGLGGVRVLGDVTGRFGRQPTFDAKLEARSINLDSLLQEKHDETKSVNLSKAADEIEKELSGFLVPKNVTGDIAVKVDGIIYRAGVIQNFEVEAKAKDGALDILKATGKLPGQASLDMKGLWSPAPGGTEFAGSLQLQSDNPRALAQWAGWDLTGLGPDRLTDISLSSRVLFERERQLYSNAALVLDGQAYDVSWGTGHDGQIHGLKLTANKLDLDAYHIMLPQVMKDALANFSWHGLSTGKFGQTADLDVALDVQALTFRGQTLDGFATDFRVRNKALTVESFVIDHLAGAAVDLRGANRSSGNDPNVTLTSRIDAADFGLFFRTLGLPYADEVARLNGSLQLDGALSELGQGITIAATLGGVSDAPLAVTGQLLYRDGVYTLEAGSQPSDTSDVNVVVTKDQAADTVRLTFKGKADTLEQLLTQYGVAYRPRKVDQGPVAFRGGVTLAQDVMHLEDLTLTVGDAALSVTRNEDDPTQAAPFRGDVVMTTLHLDDFLPPASETLSPTGVDLADLQAGLLAQEAKRDGGFFAWLARQPLDLNVKADALTAFGYPYENVIARLQTDDGVLRLTDIAPDLLGGDPSASVSYTAQDALPELKGQASLKRADVGTVMHTLFDLPQHVTSLDGELDAQLDFSALGRTQQSMTATLNGTGRLEARDGAVAGVDVAALKQAIDTAEGIDQFQDVAKHSLLSGQSAYHKASGDIVIDDGRLRVLSSADSNDDLFVISMGKGESEATMALAGEIDFNTDVINGEGLLRLASYQNAPPAKIRVMGPIAAPERRIETAALGSYFVADFAKRSDAKSQSDIDRQIDLLRSAIEGLEGSEATSPAENPQ